MTLLTPLKNINQIYSSTKNFVIRDSQNKIIETTQTKNKYESLEKDNQKTIKKAVKIINFLKNS